MADFWTALGTMSGTSLDGVDAAILRTDGEALLQLGPWLSLAYDEDERATLRAAVEAARGLDAPDPHHPTIAAARRVVTDRHVAAVQDLLSKVGMRPGEVDVLGFHGQTVTHRPESGWTWQIGDAASLAAKTGIDVVADFRAADMTAGGHGAPFAPLYHAALLRAQSADLGLDWPVAVLNLGGVANVTWIGAEDGDIRAFDTGPGVGLLDDWLRRSTGAACDENGQLAATGRAHTDRRERIVDPAWLAAPPPKSLDRHAFSLEAIGDLAPADGAATLVDVTAWTVARARDHMPALPRRWLVAGGGRHNPALMAALAEHLDAALTPVDDLGWRGDALEAETFAYLAVRSRRDLPLSLPATTGAARPVMGGRLWPAG